MENWGILFIIIFSILLLLTAIIVFMVFLWKVSKKKLRTTFTYFGMKKAKVRFKALDTFISHSFLVIPKKEYEVVYRMETEEGKVSLNLDNQLKIETKSRTEGSEFITFSRIQPIISFKGEQAKNGECSVRLYKRRY